MQWSVVDVHYRHPGGPVQSNSGSSPATASLSASVQRLFLDARSSSNRPVPTRTLQFLFPLVSNPDSLQVTSRPMASFVSIIRCPSSLMLHDTTMWTHSLHSPSLRPGMQGPFYHKLNYQPSSASRASSPTSLNLTEAASWHPFWPRSQLPETSPLLRTQHHHHHLVFTPMQPSNAHTTPEAVREVAST